MNCSVEQIGLIFWYVYDYLKIVFLDILPSFIIF